MPPRFRLFHVETPFLGELALRLQAARDANASLRAESMRSRNESIRLRVKMSRQLSVLLVLRGNNDRLWRRAESHLTAEVAKLLYEAQKTPHR